MTADEDKQGAGAPMLPLPSNVMALPSADRREKLRIVEALLFAASEPLKPAVPVRRSVTPEYLVCLEDGKKLKMLKRHLRAAYGMSPDEYRAKWSLPPDYPMVAPNYAAQRSDFAKKIGLGRKPGQRPGRRARAEA